MYSHQALPRATEPDATVAWKKPRWHSSWSALRPPLTCATQGQAGEEPTFCFTGCPPRQHEGCCMQRHKQSCMGTPTGPHHPFSPSTLSLPPPNSFSSPAYAQASEAARVFNSNLSRLTKKNRNGTCLPTMLLEEEALDAQQSGL